MKAAVIFPGVVHLSFPNRKEMTLSLCRAQEHYEAADGRLRGERFTWEEFIDVFAAEDGKIDYFSFWSGFNFPGDTYLRFLGAFQGDLSSREEAVKNSILDAVDADAPFYVIGTLDGAEDTLKHEILHAIYHIDARYRSEAVGLVLEMDHGIRMRMKEGLSKLGYGDNVMHDEIQAYLGSGDSGELGKRFGLSPSECETHCPPFRELAGRFLESQAVERS